MTDFSVTPNNLTLLGFAEPRVPCDADRLDLGRGCACWNFRNFTPDDWCNLAS